MLTTGSYAIHKATGNTVQIIEIKTLWGIETCKVYDTILDTVVSVSMQELRESEALTPLPESFVRFVAAWCRVQNELAHGMVFDISESVIPLPHQRYALERVMATNDVRYMLADEVGLGKTIEAGLAIKELKTRGLIERVLVVCPKGLTTQWEAEMLEKFGERFTVISPEDYGTLKKLRPEENVFEPFASVISPMDAIKPLETRVGWSQEKVDSYNQDRIEAIVAGGWDLIIIDEAHRVAGSTSEVARHKLGTMLAKASPHLLLLTATPHSGKTEPFLRLMRLLDGNAFPNAQAIVREQVAPYLIRTEKREAVDNQGQPLFKQRHTQVVEIEWEARHALQQQLYEAVTEYVREGYNKAKTDKKQCIGFLMVLFQRLVSSSTEAILDALERRLSVLTTQADQLRLATIDELTDNDMEESLEDALRTLSGGIAAEKDDLGRLLALAKQAKVQATDAKTEHLTDLLDRIRRREPEAKIIMFTEFVATQKALRQMCEFNGFSTTLINGSMSLEERNASLMAFRREKDILISTDAGGEGLNLQFAHIVINFDLPWNPMKIEQRIGRADRIGQVYDVQVYNYILKDTVENRVRTVLEDKLSIIFEELGIDKLQDVLNSESAEMDFTKVYLNTITAQRFGTLPTDNLSKDISQQVGQAMQVRSIIKEEKQLHPDADIEKSQHSFHAVLRQMLREYYAWKNLDVDLLTDLELSVTDKRIQDLLTRRQVWHPKNGLPVLSFEGLQTEGGFWTLWEVAVGPAVEDKRMLSVFLNETGLYRPAASKLLWEELLSDRNTMQVVSTEPLSDEQYTALVEQASHVAEDAFLEMRSQYEVRHETNYKKQQYALTLRLEAAHKIGIDNIRESRLQKLEDESEKLRTDYEKSKVLCPDFRPILICQVR